MRAICNKNDLGFASLAGPAENNAERGDGEKNINILKPFSLQTNELFVSFYQHNVSSTKNGGHQSQQFSPQMKNYIPAKLKT